MLTRNPGGVVLQCFLNADLRSGHNGLGTLCRKNGISVNDLVPGQYVVFVNSAKDRIKVYAANNIIAYMKLPRGDRVDLRVVQAIPRSFRGGGNINYDAALKESVTAALARKKRMSALQVFRSEQSAGLHG